MDKSELVLENINLVHGLLHKYHPSFAFDEDIIQCGMLGLCKAAETYNEERGKFSTYASRVILNEIRQEFRRRKKYNGDVSLSTVVHSDEDNLTLEEQLVSQDNVNYSDDEAMLSKLTKREREVALLRSQGYKQEEIAIKLGVDQPTVSKICTRIKSKWRDWK